MIPVHVRLKAETAALHERVESAMPSLEALGGRDTYARCLQRMHTLYEAWEPAAHDAHGIEAVIPDIAGRRKLPLLRSDLRALDVALTDATLAAPRLDVARALGAMYVMEGATLGGQVILRHIAAPLGLTREGGLAFFSGYGERTGMMWSAFCSALDAWSARTGRGDQVVEGAIACFTAFERELARP